jgi:hypothetical protein
VKFIQIDLKQSACAHLIPDFHRINLSLIYGSHNGKTLHEQNKHKTKPIMKTRSTLYSNLAWLVIALSSLTCSDLFAQRFSKADKVFIGLQGSMGTRLLQLNTDLSDYQRNPETQGGGSLGVLFGTQIISVKFSQGFFKSTDLTTKSLKQSESLLSIQLYPIQKNKGVYKYFSSYIVSGLGVTGIKMNGTYFPPVKKGEAAAPTPPTCCCPGALPVSDELKAEELPEEKEFSGKLVTSRFNIGLGVQVNIQKTNNFGRLFAEMRYGIPVASNSNTPALLHTKGLKQMSVDFGIVFGITKR